MRANSTHFLNKKTYLFVGTINISLMVLVYIVFNSLPPIIPIYYGMPSGTEQLATREALFIPGIFGCIVLLLNILVAKFVSDSFLQKTVEWTAVAITTLSAITVVRIILLVGNL